MASLTLHGETPEELVALLRAIAEAEQVDDEPAEDYLTTAPEGTYPDPFTPPDLPVIEDHGDEADLA